MSKTTSRLRKTGVFTLAAEDSTTSSIAAPPPPAYSVTAPPAVGPASDTNPPVVDGKQPPDAAATNEAEPVNITAAFEKLSLTSPTPSYFPTTDACLAHLKLLFALQSMKEDVGYTDGLWGLWDSRAGPIDHSERSVEERAQDKQLQALSQIREKRWALFVARAVERYEAWWRSFPRSPLSEGDMMAASSDKYIDFTKDGSPPLIEWSEEMLPPLGMALPLLCGWHF
jgi:hypothetical protein